MYSDPGSTCSPGELVIRDFAKASIVDLIVRQFQQTHPELIPAGGYLMDPVRHATVSGSFKKDILKRALLKAGPKALLSVGQGIGGVTYDPLWRAAIRTASPEVLFDKWRRLERFGHSQNRLRISQVGEAQVSFQRYGIDGGTPDRPENFLICGLIIALLEEIGCTGLQCDMPGRDGRKHCIRQNGKFLILEDSGVLLTDSWTIQWKGFSPPARNTETAAELLRLAFPLPCGTAVTIELEAIIRLLLFDPARRWKVGELASQTGMSKRSLQRKLDRAGLCFTLIIRLVRLHEACRLLEAQDGSITEIGFCSGFSDSAHFSRDFRASMGMTPREYRNCLRSGPSS